MKSTETKYEASTNKCAHLLRCKAKRRIERNKSQIYIKIYIQRVWWPVVFVFVMRAFKRREQEREEKLVYRSSIAAATDPKYWIRIPYYLFVSSSFYIYIFILRLFLSLSTGPTNISIFGFDSPYFCLLHLMFTLSFFVPFSRTTQSQMHFNFEIFQLVREP